ncbi:SDR family oxidoreductase [Enterovirga rhinocerotis]|uniref:3-oxoacyl-[acyl-carrier protein] reductase n=1 Tax=Enterovirga rhinocerotis TaxID=1339210 RepID=A0A4R7C8L5_9HYPH|nr:SDR family oxidoreductase [Enterovirga rhinocerotis]TDR94980.1 3-oxoacyl-[acyl-carrier protein] reductase [Enterovirga rhinocerotis]
MRLAGKRALVTGAAAGFGRVIAETFAREGASVVLADRDGDGARTAAAALGAPTTSVAGDVSSVSDVARMVAAAQEAFGGLDIVVNNAGIISNREPHEEVEEETFDRLMAINVKSLYCMSRAAVPVLRQQGTGGSIVNIGSTGGLRPRPGVAWYNGSKGAVHAITKTLAVELAPDNIRVNAIAPALAPTSMINAVLGGTDTEEGRAAILTSIPLGRLCAPSDVANACLWLCEDASSYITGIIVPVDGGRTV